MPASDRPADSASHARTRFATNDIGQSVPAARRREVSLLPPRGNGREQCSPTGAHLQCTTSQSTVKRQHFSIAEHCYVALLVLDPQNSGPRATPAFLSAIESSCQTKPQLREKAFHRSNSPHRFRAVVARGKLSQRDRTIPTNTGGSD